MTIWRNVSNRAAYTSSRRLLRPVAPQIDSDCSRRQCPSSSRTICSKLSAHGAIRLAEQFL
jgi:hypothetical protein